MTGSLPARAERQFQSDGTFEDRIYRKDGSVYHSSKGKYRLDGDELTLTQSEVTSSSGKVSNVHAVTPLQLQWDGDDTVVFSDKSGSLTYKRE